MQLRVQLAKNSKKQGDSTDGPKSLMSDTKLQNEAV